jgi:hypothetical protein
MEKTGWSRGDRSADTVSPPIRRGKGIVGMRELQVLGDGEGPINLTHSRLQSISGLKNRSERQEGV